jgi:hypothetical protein
MNLSQLAAYHESTPYELWQKSEGLPVVRGHCVEDLRTLELAPWKRKAVSGTFINLIGSGRTCDAYVCELPPRRRRMPSAIYSKS